jgi:hypothetical protein
VNVFETLVDEARRVGYRVELLIDPVCAPSRSRYSRLSALVLRDAEGNAVIAADLLGDDRLDAAAAKVIHIIKARRS